MQYYPPLCVTPNGGQTFPCNPLPQCSFPSPQVVGEGTVAAVTLPDGSTQLYFVPTPPGPNSSWPPHANYPPWNNNPQVWFIRSIPNQFQLPAWPAMNQQYSLPSLPWLQSGTDWYGNKLGYQLKLHLDNCTSTTDLHYFSPLRSDCWFPKQCSGTQTELPPNAPVDPPHCAAQRCACYKQNQIAKKHGVVINDKSSCSSSMSVDATKDAQSSKKKRKKTWFSRKNESEKSSIKCECDLPSAPQKSDKATATFAEKTVGCCADNGRETQTACGPSTPIRRVNSFFNVNHCETEMWYPKTPLSRKVMDCGCRAESGADSEARTSTAFASDSSDGTSRNENDSDVE